jgi:CD109 antigen
MLGDVFIVSIIGLVLTGTSAGKIHYTIVAPVTFRPSSTYNVTAACYNVTDDVQLTLRIQTKYTTLVEKQAVLKSDATQILSLSIPDDVPAADYFLMAEGSGGLKINDSRSVSAQYKTLSIFVQTDKAMYKPGQAVLFRAIVLYPDLKPYQEAIDIVIFDLAGNRIMQWLDQRNESGVISQQLQLSTQTPLGDWKIIVTAGQNSVAKTFQVAEYVLPKFSVTVSLPSYYLVNANRQDLQKDLRVSVVAKYTYGQPVKGRANVTIQLKPYSYWDTQNYTRLMKDVQLVDGKADLTISIRELLSLVPITYYSFTYTPDLWSMLSYRTILVVANVNETVTGIVLSGNSTVLCSSQKYQLTFLSFSPNNYKAGLLYTAFMQLSQPDGKAPDSSDIVLPGGSEYSQVYVKMTMNYPPTYDRYGTPTYYQSTYSYLNLTITPSGFMTLPLLIDTNDNVLSVNLEPSFYVYETNSTVTGYKTINVFKSRDNQGIRITYDSQDGVIKPLKSATFNVTSTDPITTFQYQVLGKGGILLNDKVVGDLSTEHSFSIWISKDLALKLAPSARFVVWFITNMGEIITDSTELNVGDYFANQVSLWFDEESTTPSGNATLTVSAYQGSYVGLLVVDQSVLLLKAGNDITQDMVSNELKAYSSGQNNYYPQPIAIDRRRKRSIWWPYYIGGDDSYTIFSNAGLLVMTDGFFYRSSGYNNIPMGGAPGGNQPRDGAVGAPGIAGDKGPSSSPSPGDSSGDSSEPPREDFPETWIWSDAVVGPDGQVAISAYVPDTITSWIASAFAVSQVAGLGVATQTANLTVFKQFFLSPNLPYSVIRGEQFALQVTVFNYMPTRLDATVTLAQSNYYKIQGSSSKMAQVESNDAASVYYWIMPGALGQIPIDISVKSAVAGDAVRVMLLVKPEGVQQQYSTSVFVQLSSSTPTYNTTMDVSLPPVGTLVPGSQYIEVTTIGDLMGSSIRGLDNLLQMPYGCGEQNMLNFAPDVSIVKYLSTSFQLTSDLENKAVGFMNAGYQGELTYQRSDGSFSAFGNNDLSGSVWLSAFVIKSFHQAKDYIAVDDVKIAQTMRWIIAQQTANGSFVEPPYGRVIHVDMQGGSAGGLPLTAYVLIALIENQNNSQMNSSAVNRSIASAKNYLENNLVNAYSDPYALSIIGYSLFRARSSKYGDVLQMLERLAKVEGGTKHWEKVSNVSDSSNWRPPYIQARAVNIEMTSYVLLTYSQLKNLTMCLPIVKWIIAQRNANGGFSSTQDTVMALEALADFATMIYGTSAERNLQITIATDSVRHNYLPITAANSILLQSYELPPNTTQVAVTASGKGSALVQLDVTYNVYKTDDVSGVELDVTTKQNGDKITVKICCSWTKKEGSGMVTIEFFLLTGYQPSNLDDLRNDKDIKLVDSKDEKVVLYLDQLTSNETCIDVILNKVFLVSNVKDAAIKVYPYYDPSGGITKFYAAPQSQNSVCTECPDCCSGGVRITPTPAPKSTKSTPSPSLQRTTPQPLKKSSAKNK